MPPTVLGRSRALCNIAPGALALDLPSLSTSMVYNDQPKVGQDYIGEYDIFGDSGSAPGDSWDQESSAISVGQQGLGAEAGNRIRWPWDQAKRGSVPVYYHDAATARVVTGERGDEQDSPDYEGTGEKEEEEKGVEGGKEQALEYVGCFRDHPSPLREYSGERSTAEETPENGALYVSTQSMTVNVRDRLLPATLRLSK